MKALCTLALAVVAGLMTACGGAANGECSSNAECVTGEECVQGMCVARRASSSNALASCGTDDDCVGGMVCNAMTNTCEAREGAGSCSSTGQCSDNQYCNGSSHQCAPLAPGFCRNASQCH